MNAWDTGAVPRPPVPTTPPVPTVTPVPTVPIMRTLPTVPIMTTVHLLRHGKVQNPDGILYGRLPDFHLAASGRAMAQGIADALAGADITHLGASPLERAQQTAVPFTAATGLPIVTDDRLIEAGNTFEGTRFGAHSLSSPQTWAVLRNPARPSWGEPYLDIARRMLGAVVEAEQAARGHVAVLVSHQLPIWTLRRFLEGRRLWHHPSRRECALASLTSVHFTDGVVTGITYAEPVGHIAAVDDPIDLFIDDSIDGSAHDAGLDAAIDPAVDPSDDPAVDPGDAEAHAAQVRR